MGIKFNKKNIKVVPIDDVRPNTYNPKDKNTPSFEKVKDSLRLKGQRLPVVVRENNGFEIVDGEQRWTAAKALGFKDILIYSEGELSDKESKELTIWYEQKVPFNELMLAELVNSLKIEFPDTIEVPFNEEELIRMEELVEFNWDDYQKDPKAEEDEDSEGDKATFSIELDEDDYAVVMEALHKARTEHETNHDDAKALVFIAKEYLSEE